MSTEFFVRINDAPVTSLRLVVAQYGAWCLDAVMEDDAEIGQRVTVMIGQLQLQGTVAPQSGTFGARRSVRVVAGANGWGKILGPQSYANDAGVGALLVAQDAARGAGEQLGTFAPENARVGPHFIRQAGIASRALEQAIGGAGWWVDYEGVTHVGPRATVQALPGSYEVLFHDPRTEMVTLAVDDPTAIGIGSVLSERLDKPQTVREFELNISEREMRILAWCGGTVETRGRLSGTLERIITTVMSKRILGSWRYRVVELAGDRVNLQIVRRATGLPDVLRVPHWPGVAGVSFKLAVGAEVLVEFLDGGDPSLPAITGYAGAPENMSIQAVEEINFFEGTQGVARNGDEVEIVIPPGKFNGTIMVGGTPTPAVNYDVYFPRTMRGKLTGGSSKVKFGG